MAEMPEVRAEVEAERQKRYKDSLEEFGKQSTRTSTPEEYQAYVFHLLYKILLLIVSLSAINHLYPYLQQVAKTVNESTGFAISMVVGGPSPALGGEIVTSQYVGIHYYARSFLLIILCSIHMGVTDDEQPLDFGSFSNDLFSKTYMPKFLEFLQRLYRAYIYLLIEKDTDMFYSQRNL